MHQFVALNATHEYLAWAEDFSRRNWKSSCFSGAAFVLTILMVVDASQNQGFQRFCDLLLEAI